MKFKISNFKFFFILTICGLFTLYGCSGSGEYSEEKDESENDNKVKSKTTGSISQLEIERKGIQIVEIAKEEQKNKMYSTSNDSTFYYWLNNQIHTLENFSKCNIFAMNVLFKAGCKCPEVNVTTYDLMDTSMFIDILPLVKISDGEKILKGDLIIWNGHVIIFESYVYEGNNEYVIAWWGGSKQMNNGINIINDVAHGKYPLEEGYIVRRPVLW